MDFKFPQPTLPTQTRSVISSEAQLVEGEAQVPAQILVADKEAEEEAEDEAEDEAEEEVTQEQEKTVAATHLMELAPPPLDDVEKFFGSGLCLPIQIVEKVIEENKKNAPKCGHGRRREICKECGGSRICEHGKQRQQCKECGGSQICEHGNRRQQCKECGGSQICEHGRQRPYCKECGGSQICEHGRRRSICKECGGSQICEHGKRRYRCGECKGRCVKRPRPTDVLEEVSERDKKKKKLGVSENSNTDV